ncbi:MAG: (d)CMP kinase, partial [Peptostreptococcales bacterium]
LTASVERRAERRYREMLEKGYKVDIEDIKADIEKRDKNDMERELNPLRKNKDAIEIDSSFMTIDEVVQKIISYIK